MEPTPTTPETVSGLGAAPLFEPHVDRNALDRMLLAFAVHEAGPGFRRAHLLLWNAHEHRVHGRLSWSFSLPGRGLAEALTVARRQASEGTDPEATRALKTLALAPDALEGAPEVAWAAGGAATGGPEPRRPWGDGAAIGAVTLHADRRPYGLIVGEWDRAPADAANRLESLRRIGGHALAAAESVERRRRAARQAAAMAELARVCVGPHNIVEVQNALIRLAVDGTSARAGALWRVDARDVPVLATTFGTGGGRERIGQGLGPLAAAVMARGRPLATQEPGNAAEVAPAIADELRAVAVVPLAAYARSLGAIAVYDRAAFHPADPVGFDPEDVAYLGVLADLGALAIAQATSECERAGGERLRQELAARLGRAERLAALGERWAHAARELRNPVAAIGAFARRVHRALGDDDPNRDALEVIVREVGRVDRLLAEHAEGTSPEPPRFAVASLNAVVQEVLQEHGETLVRRRLRLLKRLAPELPALLLDVAKVRRVVENVLGQALDAAHPGGRIRIETRRVQGHVVLDLAHDGRREGGSLLEELFTPLASERSAGQLGLGTAREIVRRHGGEIRVRSEGEWASIFSLTLPVKENDDRRATRRDRRAVADRRAKLPVV